MFEFISVTAACNNNQKNRTRVVKKKMAIGIGRRLSERGKMENFKIKFYTKKKNWKRLKKNHVYSVIISAQFGTIEIGKFC